MLLGSVPSWALHTSPASLGAALVLCASHDEEFVPICNPMQCCSLWQWPLVLLCTAGRSWALASPSPSLWSGRQHPALFFTFSFPGQPNLAPLASPHTSDAPDPSPPWWPSLDLLQIPVRPQILVSPYFEPNGPSVFSPTLQFTHPIHISSFWLQGYHRTQLQSHQGFTLYQPFLGFSLISVKGQRYLKNKRYAGSLSWLLAAESRLTVPLRK